MHVYIIGIGPGHPDLLTIEAKKVIADSSILVGDKRMLQFWDTAEKEIHETYKPSEICRIAAAHANGTDTMAVLVSGDVGFFSLAELLRDIPGCHVTRIPGISSLVYFAAKLQIPWQDAYIISRHGRQAPLVWAVQCHFKVFCLTGGEDSVSSLCQELCRYGLQKVYVQAGIDLSYPQERIVSGTAAQLAQQHLQGLAVMMIQNDEAIRRPMPYLGLDDTLFLRDRAPMTKQEVRCIALSKLQPQPDDIIYDVGAGTGSCSIELALQVPWGHVYAMEINKEALQVLQQNKEQFAVSQLTIVAGDAAETIQNLPVPQRVFIGGTKGRLGVILDRIYQKNPGCSVVMTAITVETLAVITAYYALHTAYTLDITQVSIAKSKAVGTYHMMIGQNPIYILSAYPKKEKA